MRHCKLHLDFAGCASGHVLCIKELVKGSLVVRRLFVRSAPWRYPGSGVERMGCDAGGRWCVFGVDVGLVEDVVDTRLRDMEMGTNGWLYRSGF